MQEKNGNIRISQNKHEARYAPCELLATQMTSRVNRYIAQADTDPT
jgi:hypothetical protein